MPTASQAAAAIFPLPIAAEAKLSRQKKVRTPIVRRPPVLVHAISYSRCHQPRHVRLGHTSHAAKIVIVNGCRAERPLSLPVKLASRDTKKPSSIDARKASSCRNGANNKRRKAPSRRLLKVARDTRFLPNVEAIHDRQPATLDGFDLPRLPSRSS